MAKKATKAQKDYILAMCEKGAYGIPRVDYMKAINSINTINEAKRVIIKSRDQDFTGIDDYLFEEARYG